MALLDAFSDSQTLLYSQAELRDFNVRLQNTLQDYPELWKWINEPGEQYFHTQSHNHKLRLVLENNEWRSLDFLDAMMNVMHKDTLKANGFEDYTWFSRFYAFQVDMSEVSDRINYEIAMTSERVPTTLLFTSINIHPPEGRDFDQYIKNMLNYNGTDERYTLQADYTTYMRLGIPDDSEHCVVYEIGNRLRPEVKPRLAIFYEGIFTRNDMYRVAYIHTLHQIACANLNTTLPDLYVNDMVAFLKQLAVLQHNLTVDNYDRYINNLMEWFHVNIRPKLTEYAYEAIVRFFKESALMQTREAESKVTEQRDRCRYRARELRDAQLDLERYIRIHHALKMHPIEDTSGQEFVDRLRSAPDIFSNVRTSTWGSNQVELDITIPLSQYDMDAAYEYYNSHIAWEEMFRENPARRELFKEIFIDRSLKVIFTQRITVDVTTHEIDFINSHSGNPHLAQYRCLGGYHNDVFDAIERNDYGTMLDILVSSVSNVDLYDNIVMNHWFAVWSISEGLNLVRPDGTRTSFVQYLNDWKLPEGVNHYATPNYQGKDDPLETLASDEYWDEHDRDDDDDDYDEDFEEY